MTFFDKLQKKGFTALKQEKHTSHVEIRKTAVPSQRFIHPIHSKRSKAEHSQSRPHTANTSRRQKPLLVNASKDRLRQGQKRASTASQSPMWGSDDDASDEDLTSNNKRQKMDSTVEPDLERTIRSQTAFSDEVDIDFKMVHAADIANVEKPKEFKLAFPDFPEVKNIYLQYPSASPREKYELVYPRSEDDFKSLEDIRLVMEKVAAYYLPPDIADAVTDDSTGLIRRLKRATKNFAADDYCDCIREWNDLLHEAGTNGTLETVIKGWKTVDLELCEFILTQSYARTVSLMVNDLRKYKNGEDNVYGELLPKFVSTILKKDLIMKADQVFVDLGSGVGNVVLQAALEVGCESWGCEEMQNAHNLAVRQKSEFEARCRLWGLSKGDIHLVEGDFLKNDEIKAVLKRADVVLVNNQAFTPALNDQLTYHFLDLKDGAKVVSLKSFAPTGQQGQSRSAGAIHNILDVSEKRYYSGCVSWTNASGTYYIASKGSTKVKAFNG